MNNNVPLNSDFGHAGPCATFNRQHFQMVDLITLNCTRTMNPLNPHALPHEPKEQNIKCVEESDVPRKVEKVE